MRWQAKALLQQLIARLPASDAIYYQLQRRFGELRDGRFDPTEWIVVASEMLTRLQTSGLSVRGKRCLEVGTGRAIGLPIVLWLCGAAQIVTIDINRYLSSKLVEECRRCLVQNGGKMLHGLQDLDEHGGFRDRFDQLSRFNGDTESLLKLINTTYIAPGDATHVPFPDHSFDFHFSYSVLEHVPASEIVALLVEARRVLCPGGFLWHVFDLSDHFSYADDSITRINFLRFSDAQWRRWAGNKYMYHNRLRASEFVNLFRQAGVRIKLEIRGVDSRSVVALSQGFPVNHQFRTFPNEELAVTAMQIMGTFSAGAVGDATPMDSHPVEVTGGLVSR